MIRNLTAAILLLASNAAFSQLSKSVMERFTCDVEDVEFIQVFQIPDITPETGKPFVVTDEMLHIDMDLVATYFRDKAIHTWQNSGLYVVICVDSTYSAKAYGSFFVINEDYVEIFEKNEGDLIVVEDNFIVNLDDQPVCSKDRTELVQALNHD